MLRSYVSSLVDKYVLPYANVDQTLLEVGLREGQVSCMARRLPLIVSVRMCPVPPTHRIRIAAATRGAMMRSVSLISLLQSGF